MSASLLDGKIVAEAIRNKVHEATLLCSATPGLAVVLVGDDPASQIYVRNKRKACALVGFNSYAYDLPYTSTEKELLDLINELNKNPAVNGILVQLPLPSHINETVIIETINVYKDVDGFHPANIGRLAENKAVLRPCTPLGIMEILKYYKIDIKARSAVVVGASNIVGRPMALELLNAKATITICHSATKDLDFYIKNADIIIVATGFFNVIEPDWLNSSQTVIDVGIHRTKEGKIHGDIDFDRAKERVAYITPVPGGVGPVTISILLQNTILAYNLQNDCSLISSSS